LRDGIEERLSRRREAARRRPAASEEPAIAMAEPALDAMRVEPAAAQPIMRAPEPVEPVHAREIAGASATPQARSNERDDTHEEHARRALEAAAQAAQSMAQEFAQARTDGAWSRPAEPEALLAATPADEAPDDAVPVKMGAFAPQLISADGSGPIAEQPMAPAKVAAGPRWFRRRRTEA
jgi:hypothetical protein